MIGKTISHYHITDKLGEGGMGIVYKAHDTKLDRVVALKFLPPHLTKSEQDKARFLQEAKAASAIEHPNVCVIYDIQEHEDQQFIIMQYVEGQTLKDKLQDGPLNVKDTIDYAIQIAEALKAAHSKGIVHRDIKSENIMVPETGQVKVMDFGLAKLRGSVKLTKTSSTIGTAAYMSPEHIEGKEIDARSDIFSFGVVLYEMLTGQLPFKGEYDSAMMYAVVNEEQEPIQKYRSDLSSELMHVLDRALEKDPGERYQAVNEMLIELKRLKRDTDRVTPGHISKTGQTGSVRSSTKKKPQRHKLLIGLAAVLGLASAILAILFIIPEDETLDSLAILPFAYPSDQPEIRYLSESIPDRILVKLQKLPGLKRVIPFSSVLQYTRKGMPDVLEAGRELGVKAIGIGRMSMVNDNLEINIEIIDVKQNNLILKEPYTEKLADLTVIPIAIAQDITTKLGHRLSGEEQTSLMRRESDNSEAYQHYLMGRFHWNKRSPEGIQQAIEYFHRAIAQDSGFALAHAGLADAYITLPQYSGIFLDDVWDEATYAARKALALDPLSSEARMAHSNILMNEWKWEEARREIEYAIDIDPKNTYAYFMYGMLMVIIGDMDGAISKLKSALVLDPLSMTANRSLGTTYSMLNKQDEAIEQLEKTISIAPYDPATYFALSGVYLKYGDIEKSLFNLLKYFNLLNIPQVDEIVKTTFSDGNFQPSLVPQLFTHILHEIDKTRHPILSKPSSQALFYAVIGQADSLFIMMHKAIDLREFYILNLLPHPIMDPFRSDPRFQEVLERVHLDQYK